MELYLNVYKVGYAETTKLIVANDESESVLKFTEQNPQLASLPLISERVEVEGCNVIAVDDETLEKIDSINVITDEYVNMKADYERLVKFEESMKEVRAADKQKKTTKKAPAKRK